MMSYLRDMDRARERERNDKGSVSESTGKHTLPTCVVSRCSTTTSDRSNVKPWPTDGPPRVRFSNDLSHRLQGHDSESTHTQMISDDPRLRYPQDEGATRLRLSADDTRNRSIAASISRPVADQEVARISLRSPRGFPDQVSERSRLEREKMPPPRSPISSSTSSAPLLISSSTPRPPIKKPTNTCNDCEVVVVNKRQQGYAEHIESKIRELGLRVDIMFPKLDINLLTFLEQVATNGAAFAVVVRPENEIRQSVSVHVLKGVPKAEEHRNMPLVSAFKLMSERFASIRRSGSGINCPKFQKIFELVHRDRFLTDEEYNYAINSIHERWDAQRKLQSRKGYDPEIDLASKDDVQDMIMRILRTDSQVQQRKFRGRGWY